MVVSWESKGRVHPHQKPVSLLKYLIDKLPNASSVIADFTMGSGSTAVAAIQSGRKFLGAEIDLGAFEIAQKRINDALGVGSLFPPEPAKSKELFE